MLKWYGLNSVKAILSQLIYAHSLDPQITYVIDPILDLRTLLSKLSDHNPGIIIAGDFNFPAIVWDEGIGCVQSSPAYGNEVNSLFIDTVILVLGSLLPNLLGIKI